MTEEATNTWVPVHSNHAIDVMAAVVVFAQPLPELLFWKVVRLSREVALEAGLKSEQPSATSVFRVSIGPDGVPRTQAESSSDLSAMNFNAVISTPESDQAVLKLSEQLSIDRTHMIYRTWNYVSWKWQRERMLKLMSAGIEVISEAVAISTIRLEYLDRFRFDGAATAADPKLLFRPDCDFVAPNLLRATQVWHNHTGIFIDNSEQKRRLRQINLDVLDQPGPRGDSSRWAHVTTALEDRYDASVTSENLGIGAMFQTFDEMHTLLKDVLASIINDSMIDRIYLRNK